MALQFPIPEGLNQTWGGARNWLTDLLGNIFDPNRQTQPPAFQGMQAPPQSLPEQMAGMIMEQTPAQALQSGMIGMGPMPLKVITETPGPFTFEYFRHLKKSPNMGSRFGQDIEPAGKYMNIKSSGADELIRQFPNKYETGNLTFNNPMLLIQDSPLEYKKILSEKYGGLTGKKLSKAIIKDGYDGIITKSSNPMYGYGEIISLQDFIKK